MANTNKDNAVIIIISCFGWGILAHGYAMFNKLSWHDDQTALFGVGTTYEIGRWMLGLLGDVVRCVFGESNYSLPVYSGMMAILFIAVAVFLLITMYHIKSALSIVAISGVMVCIPVITGLFGYMFTAPYYMFGMLLSIAGCFLIHNYAEKGKLCGGVSVFLGSIFIACGTGTYQANFPVSVTTLLLSLFVYLINKNNKRELFSRAVIYAGALFSSLILYLAAANIFVSIFHKKFSSYAGINSMGEDSISVYVSRLKTAFINFWQIDKGNHSYNMYPMTANIIFKVMLVMLLSMSILICVHFMRQKRYFHAIMLVFLLMFFPLSVNLIFILSTVSSIHTLAMYTWIFVPVFLVLQTQFVTQLYIYISRQVTIMNGVIILILVLMYARYSNVCYLQATLLQSQTISYFDRLITRIQSVDGYTNETPIVFINEHGMHDSTWMKYSAFEAVSSIPYTDSIEAYVNTYTWATFMANWNGYNPLRGESNDYKDSIDVAQMPTYPNDGSIKMLNDVIVIKFGK